MTTSIIILISGNGSNLQAIMDAKLPCTIKAVISNKADAYGLTRAKQAEIPTHIIKDESELQAYIDQYQPDLIVLAGYMRILSPVFVQRYQGKMVNIHPSLLPAYRGLHPHERAIAAKETIHGATVHFVTEELDGGPNIIQAKVPIYPNDTFDTLSERTLKQERQIYPLAIRWFAEKKLKLAGNQAWLEGKPLPPEGFQFTE